MTQNTGEVLTSGTEVVAQTASAPRTRSLKHLGRMVGAGAVSLGMVGVFAFPAYAMEIPQEGYTPGNLQQLTTVESDAQLPADGPTAELTPEVVAPAPATTAAAGAQQGQQGQQAAAPQFADVPVGAGAAGLVAAARAQLGQAQDCTALVERALRAIGYNVGDLAPMQFAAYGTPVSPNAVQPGDIMMRGGHVAIYTGDGVNHRAVHGGFGGSTIESTFDANPGGYAVIVRLP